MSYGDQVCAWITRLHEGLQFASRYPDTDIAYKNMRLYVEGLRSIIVSVARNGPDTLPWPQPRVSGQDFVMAGFLKLIDYGPSCRPVRGCRNHHPGI